MLPPLRHKVSSIVPSIANGIYGRRKISAKNPSVTLDRIYTYLVDHAESLESNEGKKQFELELNKIACEEPFTEELETLLCTHGWGNKSVDNLNFSALRESMYSELMKSAGMDSTRSDTKRGKGTSGRSSQQFNWDDPPNIIKSYCPDILMILLSNLLDEGLPITPKSHTFNGFCLLADISGFTKLSASLCAKGSEGLDDLHKVTSGFLGHMVRKVYSHGGDVTAFAGKITAIIPYILLKRDGSLGDALICVFDAGSAEEMASCAVQVAQCALALKDLSTPQLTAHVGVTSGLISLGVVGGHKGSWTYLMTGRPLLELSSCIDEAPTKELVVSGPCYQLICEGIGKNGTVTAEETKSGNFNVRGLQDKSSAKTAAPRNRLLLHPASENFLEYARKFVPPPALHAIYSGSLGSLAALREVTTMFLKLDSFNHEQFSDPLSLQPFYSIVQRVIEETGGFMRQFLVDDKGCVVIGMWGVSSFMHTDCCSRAVRCSALILLQLKDIELECSIGVSTGNVFSGNVGSQLRRDFVGIGMKVNLSARLMSKSHGSIFIDDTTYNQLDTRLQSKLARLEEPLTLKGIEGPFHPYIVDDWHGLKTVAESVVEISEKELEVADELRQLFQTHLDAISIVKGGGYRPQGLSWDAVDAPDLKNEVQCIEVIGGAGMGKRTAAALFKYMAKDRYLRHIAVSVSTEMQHRTYSVATEIFLGLIGSRKFKTPFQQLLLLSELLLKAVPKIESSILVGSLRKLTSIMSLELDEDAVLKVLQTVELPCNKPFPSAPGSSKVEENCFSILLELLLKERETVIEIDSVDCCDEESITVLQSICSFKLPCCILLTSCPVLQSKSKKVGLIAPKRFDTPTLIKFELKLLLPAKIEQILKSQLNITEVPATLLERVSDLSNGVPYWVHLIVSYIKSRGVSFVINEFLRDDGSSLMRAAFMMRLEQLNPECQTVARYACVLGSKFNIDTLEAVVPSHIAHKFNHAINLLVEQRYLEFIEGDVTTCKFLNQTTAIYMYELIPPSEASQMHAVIGDYMMKQDNEIERFGYRRILHHYRRSRGKVHEVPALTLKSIEYYFHHGMYDDGFKQVDNVFKIPRRVAGREFQFETVELLERCREKIDPPSIIRRLFRMFRVYRPPDHVVKLEKCIKEGMKKLENDVEDSVRDEGMFQRALSKHRIDRISLENHENTPQQKPKSRSTNWITTFIKGKYTI